MSGRKLGTGATTPSPGERLCMVRELGQTWLDCSLTLCQRSDNRSAHLGGAHARGAGAEDV